MATCQSFVFLSEYVFDFVTYEGSFSKLFAKAAIDTCNIISSKESAYKINGDTYKWYLVMCNMPFFIDKIEWGVSIRGAYWRYSGDFTINENNWVYDEDGDQTIGLVSLSREDWISFVRAISLFAEARP